MVVYGAVITATGQHKGQHGSEESMEYCTNCGTRLAPRTATCPTCGQVTSHPLLWQSEIDAEAETGYISYRRMQEHRSPSSPSPVQQRTRGKKKPHRIATEVVRGKKRSYGLPRWLLVLALVAALLMMTSGVGLIYYAVKMRPAQLAAQATATVSAIRTASTRSTAYANAQATRTVQAQATEDARATATAQAQVTAQAQATATALQQIYQQATGGKLALNASLQAQDSENWDEYNGEGGGGCAFTGGALHASVYQAHYYTPCFAHTTNFGNFALEVQMTFSKGDEGGIIFRGDDTTGRFYSFRIDSSGTYYLYLTKDDKNATRLVYNKSELIKTGASQTNILTVIGLHSDLYFYINKQFAGSVNDSTFTSGEIGVLAAEHTNTTDVAFSNMRVWIQ